MIKLLFINILPDCFDMYNPRFKKYLINLLLLTVITFILSVIFSKYGTEQYVSDAIYFFAPFFFIISLAGRILIEYLRYNNSKWFSYSILGTRVAKFIIYIVIVLLYAFNNRDDAVNFILTFFVFYLVYTYFDIRSMYSILKND